MVIVKSIFVNWLFANLGYIITLVNLPNWLPMWGFILLIVAASLLGIFFLAFFVSLFFYHIFAKKLKKDSVAINLLLNQRYELMNQFLDLLKKHNVSVSKEDARSISRLERIADFQLLIKQDRDERVLSFVHSSHNIITLCETNESVMKDSTYTDLLLQFNDIEESYRQKTALYNSNILGYNYWVNVPVVSIFFKMAKKRSKDLIV